MSLSICVLASGSSGNCIYIASDTTRILVDAGTSCRRIEQALAGLGVPLKTLNAVCITHEHSDHTGAVALLHRRGGLPLYANTGTLEAIRRGVRSAADMVWNVFSTGQVFRVGDLSILPFSVPHDSYDPVGFVVSDGERRIGIATDIGMPTTLVRERLHNCHVLAIEANHDEQMLRDAARPWSLKQRIAGCQGHLSNRQAGELLADLVGPDTRAVLLVHLSAECNKPDLALRTVRDILARAGHGGLALHMTHPGQPSEFLRA